LPLIKRNKKIKHISIDSKELIKSRIRIKKLLDRAILAPDKTINTNMPNVNHITIFKNFLYFVLNIIVSLIGIINAIRYNTKENIVNKTQSILSLDAL
jgi:hypothetical protein